MWVRIRHIGVEGIGVRRKLSAVLLAMLFIASAGLGLIAKISSEYNSVPLKSTTSALGQMDPGGLPHYFGPYANYANSPVPTGAVTTLTLIAGGSGYSAPVVEISDVWGTGSGAQASATVNGGAIGSLTLISGGHGYSAPIVTIADPTGTGASATATIGGTLSGGIRKFVDSLPGLGQANANNLGNYISLAIPDLSTYPGCDYYEIALVRAMWKFHSDLPATLYQGYVQLETPATAAYSKHILLSNPDGTPIRMPDGSRAVALDNPTYLGPTIVATRDIPTRVTFYNLLPTGAKGDLFLPVDTTVMGSGMGPLDMMGMPGMKENYTQNRATLHLHGGATPWISDGTPHQWTTPSGENTQYPKGVSVEYVPDMWFVNGQVVPNTVGRTDPPVSGATNNPGDGVLTFYYTNQQGARLMFYHDHAYGITRLNVYSGEAAGYLLTDPIENALVGAGILPSLAGEYMYGIPLVIQDKTFVDATTIAYQDPTWAWGSTPTTPHTGDLWMPHVYMPNQNPYDVSGANPYGRWDYGPWFFPPTVIGQGPVPNPYYDPINAPWEPPMIPGVPRVSMGMEAFMDTPVVNGQAYPYITVEPQAYRFRILNAANDRFFNLQMYVADPTVVTSDGRTNTEVKMVPALATQGFPATWPSDGRAGGVPDPATQGPSWVQVGSEGGFLPAPAEIPNQPVTWNANMKTFNFGNVQDHSLLLGSAERADVVVDFSQFAGKTIIVYNDAPAGFPAYDPRSDYYTGDADQTSGGGAPTTQPGYGPNTRTIMQIRVANAPPAPSYDVNALKAAWAHSANKLGVFEQDQDPTLIPTDRYNSAYGGSFATDAYARIQDTSMTFSTISGTTLTLQMKAKAIHDEMGGSYDPVYGRMSGSFGLEIPTGNAVTQMFIALPFASPPVDMVMDSVTISEPTLGDGTEIWKITHNGVDTHAVHFHFWNVQLINRVAWDNTMITPDDNELGWKETVRVDPLSDTIVALRPVAPWLPWELPSLVRELDPTLPDGTQLMGPPAGFFDPAGNPVTINNHLVNYGWEYMVHCHLLEHEEMDMMQVEPLVVAPWTPRNLTGTFSGTSVNLTWIDGSIAETGFAIQRKDGPAPWATVGTLSISLYNYTATRGGAIQFNDTVLPDGTIYSYRVMATTKVGDTGTPGFPVYEKNSTPSNIIQVDTATGIVTVFAAPPPPGGGPNPPVPPPSFTYIAPSPLQIVPASGSSTYTNHAPIRINSNAGFTAANGVSSGSGTSGSPYIIENLRIDARGKSYGVYVGNTTSHFILRNCIIQNATGGAFSFPYAPDSGVVLYNVHNGVIAHNSILASAWAGVYIESSRLSTVFNNSLMGNYFGVYMKNASLDTVAWNNISGSVSGVWSYLSDSNYITGNTITRSGLGIMLAASNGATITYNSLYKNSYYALMLHASGHSYIHDNDFVANHGSSATRTAAAVQAYDNTGTNRWNATARGNHWSDWTSPDNNADGIVDSPYPIDGGTNSRDMHPLVAPIKADILTTVVVTPSPVDVILKSTQTFSAQGLSQYGVPMAGLVFSWSSNLGVMNGSALTAQAAVGTVGYVRATSGAISGDAIVTVIIGPLAHVNVTPAVVSVVGGSYQLFSAFGTDAYYNNITGLTFIWATDVGTVTSYGLLTAQMTAGVTGFVSATNGTVTGTASVTITAVASVVNHIVITPGSANVTAGSIQVFSAVAYDQFNVPVTGVAFTWATNVGTMVGSNLTAQTTAGLGYVTATSSMVVGTAFVAVVPGALNRIVVSPANLSVAAGSQTQFNAVGVDAYNNTVSGLTFSWTTTVGSVSSTGLFTAQTLAGVSGFVNASVGLVKGSAAVSVAAGSSAFNHIVVSPGLVNLTAGGSQTFTAVAYDQFNNAVPGVVFAWATDVGTMIGSTLTAATAAGPTGYVSATSNLVVGVAFVKIVPAALDHIVVAPAVVSVAASSQALFIATGQDVYNNTIPGLVYTWTTNVGSVSSAGLFTAQSVAWVSGYVNASNGSKVGSAAVSIIAVQSLRIVVSPTPITLAAGSNQTFTAVAYDQLNAIVPGVTFNWTTTIGTMNANVLTAQTVSGMSGFVTASNGTSYGTAVVTVVPGPLSHVDVSPPTLSAVATTQTQFMAVGHDLYNNAVPGLTFNWSTTAGSITQTGLFTAMSPPPLTGFVNATSLNVTGSAVVNLILNAVSRIVITPSSATVVAGAVQNFSAVAYDVFGNLVPALPFGWSTNVGTMIGSNLTAQAVAGVTGYVRASFGIVHSDSFVSIVPGALNHIDVSPATLTTSVGSQTQFLAVGKDVLNNSLPALTFVWTTNVGTVSATGLFTAQTIGGAAGHVNASSGAVTGSAQITVSVGFLTMITVTPSAVTLVAGSPQTFNATATDHYGNNITGLPIVWTTNIGSMLGSTLTAQTVSGMTGVVLATYGSVSGFATVSIVPGVLSNIVISPPTLATTAGTVTQFTASPIDAYGNAITGLVINWTSTLGTVSGAGLFTAPATSGVSGFVNASSGGIVGSAIVTVTTNLLVRIVVAPATVSVAAGATQTFNVTGYDQYNNTIPGLSFSWTTNVGTVVGGLFTAQTTAGVMGFVVAASGPIIGFAWVTIVPSSLNHITVTPTPSSVIAGAQAQFTATGQDAYNNVITGMTFVWTTNVGSVSQTGLLTAQPTPGATGYVNASSGAVMGSATVSIVTTNTAPVVYPLSNTTAAIGAAKGFLDIAVDADLDPLRYTWSFGDGSAMTVGQSVSHTFAAPGTFTYTLYVDDLTGIQGHNVTTSASVSVPFVLHIAAGWNLMSLPVQGTTYTAGTLGLAVGDTVAYYNPATMTYQSFIVGVFPSILDFAIQPNAGYWVYASGPRTLTLTGGIPTTVQSTAISVPSGGGWVAVGFCSMNSNLKASSIAPMYSGASVTTVSGWDAVAKVYKTYLVGLPLADFALVPGQAYWIYVTGSGTLSYTP